MIPINAEEFLKEIKQGKIQHVIAPHSNRADLANITECIMREEINRAPVPPLNVLYEITKGGKYHE